MTEIQGNIFKNLSNFIRVIDELRDCGIEQDVKLPKIVVVGTQSAGKSSLLEQIVGLDFLPRGTGTVTRTPLEIRLRHVNANQSESFQPTAYFGEDKEKIFTDFSKDVKSKIEEITDQKAGKKKAIVDSPITLTIESSTVPNLTLIDLPGITRVPLKDSEQPEDIEQITKNLIKKYISDKMSIILCVIPANQDLSTSDALQLAREYDKEGNRTFGVLTKIDIMDRGENCLKTLNNNEIKLKHGFVGVKCRSSEDVKNNKTVKEALESEQEFFQNSSVYSNSSGKTGTKTLSNKLSLLLDFHIRENLPNILEDIHSNISEKEKILKSLGEPIPKSDNEKKYALIEKVIKIQQDFIQIMNNVSIQSMNQSLKKLIKPHGEQQILQWYLKFNSGLQPITRKILSSYKLEKVKADIEQHPVPVRGFLPFQVFSSGLKKYINKYEMPGYKILDDIHNYIYGIIIGCVEEHTYGSSSLREEIKQQVTATLQKLYNQTREIIKNIYDAEKNYIFSNNSNLQNEINKYKSTKLYHNSNVTIYDKIISDKDFMNWNVYKLSSKAQEYYMIYQEDKEKEIKKIVKQITTISGNGTQKFTNDIETISRLLNNAPQTSEVPPEPCSNDLKTKDEIFQISLLFYQYIKNVEQSYTEIIPKIIHNYLVNQFQTKMVHEVFEQVKNIDNISEVLTEDSEVTQSRDSATKSLKSLTKARDNLLRYLPQDSLLSVSYHTSKFGAKESENKLENGEKESYEDDDDCEEVEILESGGSIRGFAKS